MTSFGAIPAEFLERARHEARRYGDDAWIFLRELVQNSRDAGAHHIRFTCRHDGEDFVVTCDDDGSGMSRSDVERYLLRLYASKKAPGGQEDAAARASGQVGRFGVGFWAVLLFQPVAIDLTTHDGDESSGFSLDVEARVLRDPNAHDDSPRRGTRVQLRRRAQPGDSPTTVARQLQKYAGAIAGLGRQPPPIISVNSAPIRDALDDKTRSASHFGWAPISGAGYSGGVGLGRSPQVRLYAHGLLIREASDLDELFPQRQRRTVALPGLFPVVHVNADGLDVLMNRQAVVEDALLAKVVDDAATQVWKLQTRVLDKVAPVAIAPRVRLYLARPGRFAALIAIALVVTLSATAIGVYLGKQIERPNSSAAALPTPAPAAPSPPAGETPLSPARPSPPPTAPRTIDEISALSATSVVDDLSNAEALPPWALAYEGPSTVYFRAAVLTQYDADHGFSAPNKIALQSSSRRRPRVRTNATQVDVIARAPAGTAPFRLPTPFGHTVESARITLDGKAIDIRFEVESGLAVVTTPRNSPATLQYSTFSGERARPRRARRPPVKWPPAWTAMLSTARSASTLREKELIIRQFIRSTLRYSTRREDAQRFEQSRGQWLDRVFETQVGDCDVLNGVEVLALRSLGIPARLVVGLVGHDGSVASVLHAWTEFYDGRKKRWVFADVSPPQVIEEFERQTNGRDVSFEGVRAAPLQVEVSTPTAIDVGPDAPREPALASAETADADDDTALDEPFPAEIVVEPLTPPGPSRSRAIIALAIAAAVLLAALGLLLAAFMRTRRSRTEELDDPIVDALVDYLVRHRAAPDPLRLRLRPFFPTLRKRRISLAHAERAAATETLFVAHSENRWASRIRGVVLDATDRRVKALVDSVATTDLTPLRDVDELDAAPDDERLRLLAPAFCAAVPLARLRAAPATGAIREVFVQTKHGSRLFLFVDVDAFAPEPMSPASNFALANHIIDQTSVFREHRRSILAPFAEQALADANELALDERQT